MALKLSKLIIDPLWIVNCKINIVHNLQHVTKSNLQEFYTIDICHSERDVTYLGGLSRSRGGICTFNAGRQDKIQTSGTHCIAQVIQNIKSQFSLVKNLFILSRKLSLRIHFDLIHCHSNPMKYSRSGSSQLFFESVRLLVRILLHYCRFY